MLEVHYENLKHFDADKNCWKGQFVQKHREDKKQADTLCWLIMAIGVKEITEKTVEEIIVRTRFLDFVWGKSYFNQDPSDAALRQLFKNHLGLRIVITNRGIVNVKTRHKFMVNQLKNIERGILNKIKD